MTIPAIRSQLALLADAQRAAIQMRFFKTGPGEYGEGDRFMGVRVPELRRLSRLYRDLDTDSVKKLLRSAIHEERHLALFILVLQFKVGDTRQRRKIYDLYLANLAFINNWDLVDCSAEHIVGGWLEGRKKTRLVTLVRSTDLWHRRVAMLATFHYIKKGHFADALHLAEQLLADPHDLIHKAVGWMLREIGKRDLATEGAFLQTHYPRMPRTMLRYAIEKFPEARRQAYLKGAI
ncbi:MAG: probable DNA alkylation repair enzyme [Olavius algarvensis Delta 4 endosymbiont]|nr:MAG: probable DNA alkylation repair enzyme [Olavius algarvensis Delta 4 endosymbiont]